MKIIVAAEMAAQQRPSDFCYTETGELLGPCSISGAFTGTRTRKCSTFGVIIERDRTEVEAELVADAMRMTHVQSKADAQPYADETLALYEIIQDQAVGAEVRTCVKGQYEELTFSVAA